MLGDCVWPKAARREGLEGVGLSGEFVGRVAIVTGASSGIGLATASRLAQAGASVAMVSRGGLADAAARLGSQGARVLPMSCDVSDERQVDRMVSNVLDAFGRVDILVNNAAINQVGSIEDISLADWNRVMSVNLTGAFLCCRKVVAPLKGQRSGAIVNVSSIAGRSRSEVSGIHYVTSKAGLLGFTRQLAYELAPFNIRVNAVCPSQTVTSMLMATVSPTGQERLAASVPLGRLATSEEQASVIAFLCSDAAAYMTGAIVDVNGGKL